MATAWWKERGWKVTFVIICFGRRQESVLKQAFSVVFIQGHYCDSRTSNISQPRPCLKGHYCPAGTASPEQHPCPRGTFNPRQRARSLADCVLCAAGHYCPSVGLPEPAGAMSHLLLMYSVLAKFCFEHPTVSWIKHLKRRPKVQYYKKKVFILSCFLSATQMKRPSPNILEDSLGRSVYSPLP